MREDSQETNKTAVYAYNTGGNLTSVKEYAYTAPASAVSGTPTRTVTATYRTSGWKDQMTNWDGKAITYDAIGNMTKKGSTTYSWNLGRKLAGVENGKSIQFAYDHTGLRTRKKVDGAATLYHYAGSLLTSMETGGTVTHFGYDANGQVITMYTGGNRHFYIRNGQGDSIGLVDETVNTKNSIGESNK